MNKKLPRKAQAIMHENCTFARMAWVILVSIALGFSAPSARGQIFTTPAVISNGSPGGRPLIAVDAKDNIDIAWWSGRGVFFIRSTDQGRNFAAPVTVSTGVGGATLQMNVDGSGSIYLLWQGSNMHFLLSRSTDGRSFSTPSDLTVALNMGTFSGNLPAMALDSNGNVDLVWPQFGSSSAVWFSRSNDGGATFSAPVKVGNFVFAARTQIAINSAGEIFVLWPEETTPAGTVCALRFNRSTDSGAIFSPTVTLNSADAECEAQLLARAGNHLNILSFDGSGTSYRSADGGQSFSNSQNVFQPTTVWFGGQLNAGLQGNIDAVVNSFPNHDILFSKSTDDGATFSKPILVSASHPAPAPGGAFGGNSQSMVVDSTGNINIVWQDDIFTPGAADIFFSRSSDAGANFSAAQNISHNPGSGSPRVAVDSQGNINVVWTDANASRVFFSRVAASSASTGFTVSAAPASLAVLPGGSVTARLTLAATGGFNQGVNLSCGNLPQGAECSFNPASVTPSKAGTPVGVTLTVPPTLSTGGFPFTINATTPTISQFQNMQVSVGVLTGSVTPAATIIPLGGRASFAVTVAGTAGFAGQFSLACLAPAGVACSFAPSSGFLLINGRASSTLTVQVSSLPAAGSAPASPRNILPAGLPMTQKIVPICGLALLTALAFVFWVCVAPAFRPACRPEGRRYKERERQAGRFVLARTMATLLLTVALAAAMLSCGGGVTRGALGSGGMTASTGGTSGTPGTAGIGGTGGSAGAGGTTSGGVNMPGSTSVTFPLQVLAQSGGGVINIGTISITVP